MAIKIPRSQFCDLSDHRALAATAEEVVQKCLDDGSFSAVLCLVACYIDALSGGKRWLYLAALESDFPDLCAAMDAEVFYEKYRNGIVHEFSQKRGYAIAEEREMKGAYVDDADIESGGPTKLIALNIERLAKDFITYARRVRNEAQEG